MANIVLQTNYKDQICAPALRSAISLNTVNDLACAGPDVTRPAISDRQEEFMIPAADQASIDAAIGVQQ